MIESSCNLARIVALNNFKIFLVWSDSTCQVYIINKIYDLGSKKIEL